MKHLRTISILFVLLALTLTFSAVGFTPVYATGNIYVNSDADVIADDGACTLREAITNANNDVQLYTTTDECAGGSGTDTITFVANYTITLVGSQLPAVTSAIIINGNGSANTIIQANAAPNTATYRVIGVSASGNLTLSNLTVRNGRCDQASCSNSDRGGGIFNNGNLAMTDVTFSDNYARYGGGLFNYISNSNLTNVTFSGNSAYLDGGGMSNYQSNPILTNVTFSANSALNGGGLYNIWSNPTLTNVTFSGNFTGGGLYNEGSSPTLTNVTFVGNTGYGGMRSFGGAPILMNVTFSNNSANRGGGIFSYVSQPTLTNVTFAGNSSSTTGGGMYNYKSGSTLTNVTFSGNSAVEGGGMHNQQSSPTLTNVTFSENIATFRGGGIFNDYRGKLSLVNVILWDDSGGEIYNHGSDPTPFISYSIVQGSGGSAAWNPSFGTDGGHNLDADPHLGALTNNGGFTQTMAIGAGGPAVDAGDNTFCPATDQRGVPRPRGTTCDIGAYELNKDSKTYLSIGAHDGWVLESGEETNLGGKMDVASTTLRLGDDAERKQYRSILSFKTSDLPDNAGITKVQLKVRMQGILGNRNPVSLLQGFMVDVRKGPFDTFDLQLTDWEAIADKTVGPFNPALSGGWYTIDLTSARKSINKLATGNGLTQFRLRFKLDDNNNGAADYLKFYSGNFATAAARPTLIIEYYVP